MAATNLKHGGGKRYKKPEDKVTRQLKVYVTEEEEIILKKKAELVGMSFSSFARALLLEEEIEANPKELRQVRHELNKIGVNLNQMAKKANALGELPSYRLLESLRAELTQMLEEL